MKLKNILIIILGLFLSSFFVLGAVPENSFLGDLNSYFAGNLWIGTDSASETFYVEGDGKVNGAFTSNTLNTGQGDNELYAMNQNLETTDSPTFAGGTFNGNITAKYSISRNVNPVSVQNKSPYITNLDTADVWLSQVMNKGGVSPEWQTYTSGATHGEGDNAFSGGALTPSGKVILVPRNSNNVGIYDPETDTYTRGA